MGEEHITCPAPRFLILLFASIAVWWAHRKDYYVMHFQKFYLKQNPTVTIFRLSSALVMDSLIIPQKISLNADNFLWGKPTV